MKRVITLVSYAALTCCLLSTLSLSAQKYTYDTVPGDPMKVKMYTLPNGLKLMMSVNKDVPKVQTNIAVRVGGKNDPAETTGLAHYFEHLMFKGTPRFGTSDYALEKPMLDQIEALFETYRMTTDSIKRKEIYKVIDSISYEASKIAIPNEYDKLMSAIGSTGTNAYTGYDMTCYVENIPSNQIDNWARIQALRFREPVLRGFHTELETIYEEKNMSLTRDSRKVYEKVLEMLFPHHPYGTQTVLGTQEHLKNPSITNVKNYHKKWYVPNNIAIVMSGDFDPDNVVDIITKYFGDWQPNPDLQMMTFEPEQPITSPIEAEVLGQEAESVLLAWRFPGYADESAEMLSLIDRVLNNGNTGLLDLNVNQKQVMLGAGCGTYDMADYSAFVLSGRPKEGQTLEEVRDLLLAEIDKLRKGQFDEEMLAAIITNIKRDEQAGLESNGNRVSAMVDAFINGSPWEREVTSTDRISKITKKDITDFASKHLLDNNYAIVYKRKGKDPNELKIAKPELTPIATNRDMASDYLVEIQNTKVEPIEPVFLDFSKDLTFGEVRPGMPVYYKHNDTNDLFSLTYIIETGENGNKYLTGTEYFDLLGTPDKTPEQIKKEFYALGCNYSISLGDRRSYITLYGLADNMTKAMELMEHVLANATPDKEAWTNYAGRVVKSRTDRKGNQQANLEQLLSYALYGEDYINYGISNDEIMNLDPAVVVDAIKGLRMYPQRVIYYGPGSLDEIVAEINRHHYMPETFAELPVEKQFPQTVTSKPTIFIAPYDSNQLYMCLFSNNEEPYNNDLEPLRRLYNSYFGGDMSSIVFQEMRESRSLAYSAWANYMGTSRLDRPYVYMASIATQNDKMMDAVNAFNEIINDLPRSESAFTLAKDGTEQKLRTARTIKDGVAWAYIGAQDLGLDEPISRKYFEALPSLTLDDVVKYQQEHVKDRTYHYLILGRIEDLDMEALSKLGNVVTLSTEQIFGF